MEPFGKMLNKPFTFDRTVRIALIVGICYAAFILLDYLSDVLIPFAVAMLLAYLIDPLVVFMQEKIKVKSRVLSVTFSLIIVFGLLFLIFYLVIPIIYREMAAMGKLIANLASSDDIKTKYLQNVPGDISDYILGLINSREFQDFFTSDRFNDLVIDGLKNILPKAEGVFSETINLMLSLIGLMIIFLYLIFILKDYRGIVEGAKDLIPPNIKDRVLHFVDDFRNAMRMYFRAQGLIATIVGILFAIGFSIINLPLGIVMGLIIGALNMVPYLQTVSLVPVTFLALFHSIETQTPFWKYMGLVLIVYVVVQSIQDLFLTPKIMGNATGMNPAMILLSLSIWGKLLGMLGLLIALPVTFLLVSYYKSFILTGDFFTKLDEAKRASSNPEELGEAGSGSKQ